MTLGTAHPLCRILINFFSLHKYFHMNRVPKASISEPIWPHLFTLLLEFFGKKCFYFYWYYFYYHNYNYNNSHENSRKYPKFSKNGITRWGQVIWFNDSMITKHLWNHLCKQTDRHTHAGQNERGGKKESECTLQLHKKRESDSKQKSSPSWCKPWGDQGLRVLHHKPQCEPLLPWEELPWPGWWTTLD